MIDTFDEILATLRDNTQNNPGSVYPVDFTLLVHSLARDIVTKAPQFVAPRLVYYGYGYLRYFENRVGKLVLAQYLATNYTVPQPSEYFEVKVLTNKGLISIPPGTGSWLEQQAFLVADPAPEYWNIRLGSEILLPEGP